MATFTIDQNDPERIHGMNSNFKMGTATPTSDNGWMVVTQFYGLNTPRTTYSYKNRDSAFIGLCQLLASAG